METAARKALDVLGVELVSIPGASCCGDPISFQSLKRETWLVMAARNLALAEGLGKDMVTLCNGCYETLKSANTMLKKDKKAKDDVNTVLSEVGKEFKGSIEVKNFLEVLREIGVDKIGSNIVRPLEGLRVASHYGCHLMRPSDLLAFDDPMRPVSLDEFIGLVGAESVPYLRKMLCCGSGLRLVDSEKAQTLVAMKLSQVARAGADCMAVVCPYCMIQYDLTQRTLKQGDGKGYQIPVFYYPELLCLAMGVPSEALGLRLHRTSIDPVLKKLC